MKLIPLKTAEEQSANRGANFVAILTHEDLTETTAAQAQTIAIADVFDKVTVNCTHTILVTPFQDASDAAFNTTTLIVGDDGNTARLLASQELNANGTVIDFKPGTGAYQYGATNTVDAVFGSMTGKSLSNIDAGEVHIYLHVLDHRNLSQ